MAARLLRPSSAASPLFFSSSSSSSITTAAIHRNSAARLWQLQPRSMSSAAPVKSEWLIVVPDKPNTMAKRLEVRPIHLANIDGPRESGQMKFGGAILHDLPSDPADTKTFSFAGSTLILVAETKSEVIEFLKKDIYTKEGVWDVDNAQIYALKTAFRNP